MRAAHPSPTGKGGAPTNLQLCTWGGCQSIPKKTTFIFWGHFAEMHQTTKQSNNQPYLLSWRILVVENIWKFTCLYLVELPDRGPRWKMYGILVKHRWWHAKLYVLIFTLGICDRPTKMQLVRTNKGTITKNEHSGWLGEWGYTKYLPKQYCAGIHQKHHVS